MLIKKYYNGWLVATLFLLSVFTTLQANASLVVCNDGLVNDRAIGEIKKIGKEIREKTGISIYLCVKKSINNQKIKIFENKLSKKLKKPFILLAMAANEQKVDILTSSQTHNLIDINDILSPFSGTIIPILTERKGEDKYSAAMLNGYADIADRVAKKTGIKLNSSIGNTNRILINILRVIIYGSFLYFVVIYIKRKYFYKREKKSEKSK